MTDRLSKRRMSWSVRIQDVGMDLILVAMASDRSGDMSSSESAMACSLGACSVG